jgi:hypothetical protein
LIRDNFVPVAVNLYKLRSAKDASGDFFRNVQQQKSQYQGLWVVTADGKRLGGHLDFKSHKTWPQEVLRDLQAAVEAAGVVMPRRVLAQNPLPYRGAGRAPDGSATLAIYARRVIHGRLDGDPVIDSVTFSAADWETFVPKDRSVGIEWELPERVARQFARCVSATSDQSSVPRPEGVSAVSFKGQVIAVRDGVATLEYSGRIAAGHTFNGKYTSGEGQLIGFARCDAKTGRMLSLTWAFDAVNRGFPPYNAPSPLAAAVEWYNDAE